MRPIWRPWRRFTRFPPGPLGVPASGVAPTPNFAVANPATYTITGQDGITTEMYYVTITVLPFNPNGISNGSFEVGKDIPSPPGYTNVSLPLADLVGWNGNFTSWDGTQWIGASRPRMDRVL